MCRGEACLARHRGMMLSRDPEGFYRCSVNLCFLKSLLIEEAFLF